MPVAPPKIPRHDTALQVNGASSSFQLGRNAQPGFSGRAEPVLLLLEDAGVEYTYSRDERYLLKRDGPKEWPGPGAPPFATPVLTDGDFAIAQTTAVLEYVVTRKPPYAGFWLTSGR